MNLIDAEKPIIDLFLNPAKRASLAVSEGNLRRAIISNFPSEEIGRNLTSLFNLLWNSNLPCFGNPEEREVTEGFLLKKCFLYGREMKCRDLFKSVPTDSGICCAFNHRQLLRDSQYSRLLSLKQREERTNKSSDPLLASVGVTKGLKLILDQHSNLVTAGSVPSTSKYI